MDTTTSPSRRSFLGTLVAGGTLAPAMPGFLRATLGQLQAQDSTRATSGKDAPILVVVQLVGGNDGLNTVVPFTNDFYHRARPKLALAREGLLTLNDEFGLHPRLAGFKSLYDEGELAVMLGVGYPDQSRSHFRSIEIWQTASDAQHTESVGWLGRYLDEQCPTCSSDAEIAIDARTPRSFLAKNAAGITFPEPQQYRLFAGSFSATGDAPADEIFRRMNAIARQKNEGQKDESAPRLVAAPRADGSARGFLQRTAFDALLSSQEVRAMAQYKTTSHYAASSIGMDLELVARLIGGGMSSRVYHVSHGNYDTHVDQHATQERLFGELGDAWAAFAADMKAQGNWERVTLMTFSEFGRRVDENANGGTDHGAASALFVAGGGVHGGLHGRMPSIDPKDLFLGDLRFTTDFRSVYATVLEKRLKAKAQAILGREFPLLEFA